MTALANDIDDAELARALGDSAYSLFFEPTPYPGISYDPIELARRIVSFDGPSPRRLVAFTTDHEPASFETQCAFAAQVGRIFGCVPRVQRVGAAAPGESGAKKLADADWARALNAALSVHWEGDMIPEATARFADMYLARRRGTTRFDPTQKGLLHHASHGRLAVNAQDVADVLHVSLRYASRAITGIAQDFPDGAPGRRGPEAVGRLVAQYSWFLRYNEPV